MFPILPWVLVALGAAMLYDQLKAKGESNHETKNPDRNRSNPVSGERPAPAKPSGEPRVKQVAKPKPKPKPKPKRKAKETKDDVDQIQHDPVSGEPGNDFPGESGSAGSDDRKGGLNETLSHDGIGDGSDDGGGGPDQNGPPDGE